MMILAIHMCNEYKHLYMYASHCQGTKLASIFLTTGQHKTYP